MGIIDKLKSRAVKPVDSRPLKTETDLWRAVYGDARSTRQATIVTILTDAEADRVLAQPLTEAQKAGLAAQIKLGR